MWYSYFKCQIFIKVKVMKKLLLAFLLMCIAIVVKAQFSDYGSHNATLTIINKSDYTMTVKVMKQYGGLYQTVYISPGSYSTVSFSRSGNFYTKTKAEKKFSGTLYKKGGVFSIQCDDKGYTTATLEFVITSSGGGSMGQSISKAEFEKN